MNDALTSSLQMEPATVYFMLFAASFLAATIIPAQSEALLFGLLSLNEHPVWALLLVASVGNILGSCVNYLLGRGLIHLEGKRWFPIAKSQMITAESWYRRYGRWSLLLAWIPIIGDPLTIVAGILREPFPIFLALVSVAKIGRYCAVIMLQQGVF